MRTVDPETGRSYVEKCRVRSNEPGQPRELTFSCYRHYAFLSRDRTREWLCEAIDEARAEFGFQLWAYVFMPEHVHLVVVPRVARPESSKGVQAGPGLHPRPSKTQGGPPGDDEMSRFLQAIKEPVARKAIAFLKTNAPHWLPRITVCEGKRTRHRFWQPGGGYDRNIMSAEALRAVIDYIHANPVRRGLVARAEEWEWSRARWYAGLRPVKLEMDETVLTEPAGG